MEQESAYLALLPAAVSYRLDGNVLELLAADGTRLVTYAPRRGLCPTGPSCRETASLLFFVVSGERRPVAFPSGGCLPATGYTAGRGRLAQLGEHQQLSQ